MYAVIATGGKQYKVEEGDILRVEKLDVEAGDTITFDQVLAVRSDSGLQTGTDVSKAKVQATVLEQGRARKVLVYKYKPKTGYHKKNGHRQSFTKVRIDSIQG